MENTAPAQAEQAPPDRPYRSLLERLKLLGDELPVSHLLDITASGRLLSALVHWAEFGSELLDAADDSAAATEDMLKGDPSQRHVPLHVATVLMAPFPDLDLAAAQAAQANEDRVAHLENLVTQLMAGRESLPTKTANGGEIPVTTVSTDEPADASVPLTEPEPVAHEEPPPTPAPFGEPPPPDPDPNPFPTPGQ